MSILDRLHKAADYVAELEIGIAQAEDILRQAEDPYCQLRIPRASFSPAHVMSLSWSVTVSAALSSRSRTNSTRRIKLDQLSLSLLYRGRTPLDELLVSLLHTFFLA